MGIEIRSTRKPMTVHAMDWNESDHPRGEHGKFSTSVTVSSFSDAYKLMKDLQDRQDEASARLQAVPGIGSGQMGLTPEHVKNTPEFQSAYREYHSHTDNIHRLHRLISKHFPKEMKAQQRAEQAARHEARVARAAARASE